MAYVSKECKQSAAAALKAAIPKGWRWSLSVRNHSTLVLTIASAPVDLHANRAAARAALGLEPRAAHNDVNTYWLAEQFTGDVLATMEAIKAAMNIGNHDRSDSMTDYFDVGWYTEVVLGRWNKPFVVTAPKAA